MSVHISNGVGDTVCGVDGFFGQAAYPGEGCADCRAIVRRPRLDWSAPMVTEAPTGWALLEGWLQREHRVWWLCTPRGAWRRVHPRALRKVRRGLRRAKRKRERRAGAAAKRALASMDRLAAIGGKMNEALSGAAKAFGRLADVLKGGDPRS